MLPRLVPGTLELGKQIADNMCEEEVLEVRYSHNMTAHEVMDRAIRNSHETWAAIDEEGRGIAITGLVLTSSLGNNAVPWLLTTPKIRIYPLWFVRRSKELVSKWLNYRSHLSNHIHWEHYKALQWAEAVGFEISDVPELYGVYEEPFYLIQARRQ